MFFLELSCFFYDPMDVGNLTSGFSAFSKCSLKIWKFMVHIVLKPGLENFEQYFASVWDECNCALVCTLFGIVFLWDWNENWLFPVLGHCWVFQICWHIECSTFTASSFRIWNSSTGIPSPPLALPYGSKMKMKQAQKLRNKLFLTVKWSFMREENYAQNKSEV